MKFASIFVTFLMVIFFSSVAVQAQEQCFPEKILSSHTKHCTLKGYYIEEVMDIPSEIMINIQGEEIRLVADPEAIEKNFKGMEGKKFQITYEKVYGFVGDGCDEYLRFVSAKNIN